MPEPLLDVRNLVAGYSKRASAAVLHDVSFSLQPGGSLALVGESGSGKSTIAKVLTGQLPVISGQVKFLGEDRVKADAATRRHLRRAMQLIPQDPYASLSPRRTVAQTITEALHPRALRPPDSSSRVAELLNQVSLPSDAASRYPHEFSGGQRQRIAIARALAIEPQLIIADEVTSALDASVQVEVLDLLKGLHTAGTSFVFVTHDLEIAQYMCDSIVVLQHGEVVEAGDVSLLDAPQTEYTRTLVASVPDPFGAFLDAN